MPCLGVDARWCVSCLRGLVSSGVGASLLVANGGVDDVSDFLYVFDGVFPVFFKVVDVYLVVSQLPEVRDRVEVVSNPLRIGLGVTCLFCRRGGQLYLLRRCANSQKSSHRCKGLQVVGEWGIDVELVVRGTAGT